MASTLQINLPGMQTCMYVTANAALCWMMLDCVAVKVEPVSAFFFK